MNATDSRAKAPQSGNWVEVFAAFLRLGLTSFGGPVAHLGYFREEFVVRRCWLDERAFVDLVALCQFLPGPASSEVGIGIGLSRASYAGALAAWTGFTLPSAIAMVLFALGTNKFSGIIGSGSAAWAEDCRRGCRCTGGLGHGRQHGARQGAGDAGGGCCRHCIVDAEYRRTACRHWHWRRCSAFCCCAVSRAKRQQRSA